jgi:hypothetical protein
MFGCATWLAGVTRGTNKHIDHNVLIYLHDKHPHNAIMQHLDIDNDGNQFSDAYALTELGSVDKVA